MKIAKLILKYLFALFFASAGVNHFINTAFYLKIMPLYLPWHLPLVYLSGVFEIALGVMLLMPRFTRAAGWGLIALLIAVSPANVHMAVNAELYPEYSVAALWLRLPLQLVLIAWAYSYASGAAPDGEGARLPPPDGSFKGRRASPAARRNFEQT